MNHPIFDNIRTSIFYFSAWVLVYIINVIAIVTVFNIDIYTAAADGAIFVALFGLLALALWYPVVYNDINNQNITNILLNHLSIMVLTVTIWSSVGLYVCKLIFFDNENYLAFVDKSIAWRVSSGCIMYFFTTLIYYLIKYGIDLRNHIIQESKLKERINEAELNALKSQINPHFLFNSLNSISSLTLTNPQKAHDMIIELSGFLRYSLAHDPTKLISLKQEIENIESYLAVEKIRFGDKLIFKKEIDQACYNKLVPFLIIQPLVENAVKHGVYESTLPVEIFIGCNCTSDNSIIITIKNNFDPEAIARPGTGTGLKNINDRLKIIYQLNNLVNTHKTDNTFTVTLIIPEKALIKVK